MIAEPRRDCARYPFLEETFRHFAQEIARKVERENKGKGDKTCHRAAYGES